MTTPEGRLREHPRQRFAHQEQFFDLNAEAEEILSEPVEMTQGHRQLALYRHGPMTVGMFVFQEGGRLPDHAANGVVSIQALSGSIEVTTPAKTHTLEPGQMLVLAPKVTHDVAAKTDARMLLTVCLEE